MAELLNTRHPITGKIASLTADQIEAINHGLRASRLELEIVDAGTNPKASLADVQSGKVASSRKKPVHVTEPAPEFDEIPDTLPAEASDPTPSQED